MEHLGANIFNVIHMLALTTWVGSLIYISFVLPPLPQQDALPPVFVRMMGLIRFNRINAALLGLLMVTDGVLPFLWTPSGAAASIPWQTAKIVVLAVGIVSSIQLHGFLGSAIAVDQAQPVPALCHDDPHRVDKVLRQIHKVSRSLVYSGIAIAVLAALS